MKEIHQDLRTLGKAAVMSEKNILSSSSSRQAIALFIFSIMCFCSLKHGCVFMYPASYIAH
ncbi:unnamed protein product, partial [Brassica rapa subsp. trilocularis]